MQLLEMENMRMNILWLGTIYNKGEDFNNVYWRKN